MPLLTICLLKLPLVKENVDWRGDPLLDYNIEEDG
jgi:hypothetical protein